MTRTVNYTALAITYIILSFMYIVLLILRKTTTAILPSLPEAYTISLSSWFKKSGDQDATADPTGTSSSPMMTPENLTCLVLAVLYFTSAILLFTHQKQNAKHLILCSIMPLFSYFFIILIIRFKPTAIQQKLSMSPARKASDGSQQGKQRGQEGTQSSPMKAYLGSLYPEIVLIAVFTITWCVSIGLIWNDMMDDNEKQNTWLGLGCGFMTYALIVLPFIRISYFPNKTPYSPLMIPAASALWVAAIVVFFIGYNKFSRQCPSVSS